MSGGPRPQSCSCSSSPSISSPRQSDRERRRPRGRSRNSPRLPSIVLVLVVALDFFAAPVTENRRPGEESIFRRASPTENDDDHEDDQEIPASSPNRACGRRRPRFLRRASPTENDDDHEGDQEIARVFPNRACGRRSPSISSPRRADRGRRRPRARLRNTPSSPNRLRLRSCLTQSLVGALTSVPLFVTLRPWKT